MRGFEIGRWAFLVQWHGFRGACGRHRWGLVGMHFPTLYVGVAKIMWGPR